MKVAKVQTVTVTPRISEQLHTVLRMAVCAGGKGSMNDFMSKAIALGVGVQVLALVEAPSGVEASRLADLQIAAKEAGIDLPALRKSLGNRLGKPMEGAASGRV